MVISSVGIIAGDESFVGCELKEGCLWRNFLAAALIGAYRGPASVLKDGSGLASPSLLGGLRLERHCVMAHHPRFKML